jgi:hypothetical protein
MVWTPEETSVARRRRWKYNIQRRRWKEVPENARLVPKNVDEFARY